MLQASSRRASQAKNLEPAKRRRFHKATCAERRAKIEPPVVTPRQPLLRQLLPADVLTRLAQKWDAGDVQRRKLTCVAFF
jgi:hypothetical protein